MISDVGTAVDESAVVAAAKAAILAVNSRGGINGHQVVLDFCNENLNPSQAAACGRQMVSDGVMATVTNLVITAESDVNTILAKAGIPQVGTYSVAGASGTDPNNYMIMPTADYQTAAMAQLAVSLGGSKRVAQIALDSPDEVHSEPIAKGVVQASGGTYVGTTSEPQTATDPSTYAATIMAENPSAIILNIGDASQLAFIKAMQGLGYKGWYADSGAVFKQSDIEGLGDTANQLAWVSPFPPLGATDVKGVADFLANMKAGAEAGIAGVPTADQYVLSLDFLSWVSVIAVERVADKAGATDAKSLKAALDSATNVDLDGIITAWSPNVTPAGAAVPRVSDGNFYFSKWADGKSTLIDKDPYDATASVAKYLAKS
jgi:ABC-type branched-subunit amino acid transport system substrate-binding protein